MKKSYPEGIPNFGRLIRPGLAAERGTAGPFCVAICICIRLPQNHDGTQKSLFHNFLLYSEIRYPTICLRSNMMLHKQQHKLYNQKNLEYDDTGIYPCGSGNINTENIKGYGAQTEKIRYFQV